MKYHLVYDEHMVKEFSALLFPDIQGNEGIYVSLSARNKYLDAEARKVYQIGRSEMFNRQIVDNVDHLVYKLKQMSVYPQTSKKGETFPIEPNLMTVYLNINPVDKIQGFHNACQIFYNKVFNNDLTFDPASLYRTEVQKTRSRRNWVDLDMDMDTVDTEVLKSVANDLTFYANRVILIYTRSGGHFMLGDIFGNYTEIFSKYESKEFIKNPNEMVPLPGTMQGPHYVRYEVMQWI